MEHNSNSNYTDKLLKLLEESLRQNPPIAPTELFYDSQTKSIIRELHKIENKICLLDYGCGNLRLLKGLKASDKPLFVKYVATDVRRQEVNEFSKDDYEYVEIPTLRKEYSSCFDAIILMNVIHEISIEAIATIFEDVRRLLKSTGLFYLVDMSILPEGEPLALPFYSWEFDFYSRNVKTFHMRRKPAYLLFFLKFPSLQFPLFRNL